MLVYAFGQCMEQRSCGCSQLWHSAPPGMAVGCCELRLRSTPWYRLVSICFPTPGRGLPYGSGLGLSRCLGPGECLHSFIQFYNLTRFRMGSWKFKVNSNHLHHINRNQRYCSFCAGDHNNNVVEDEEHVLFHCPKYDICRQEYPELFLGTNMNMKNISDYDNQETIAQLLWNIII